MALNDYIRSWIKLDETDDNEHFIDLAPRLNNLEAIHLEAILDAWRHLPDRDKKSYFRNREIPVKIAEQIGYILPHLNEHCWVKRCDNLDEIVDLDRIDFRFQDFPEVIELLSKHNLYSIKVKDKTLISVIQDQWNKRYGVFFRYPYTDVNVFNALISTAEKVTKQTMFANAISPVMECPRDTVQWLTKDEFENKFSTMLNYFDFICNEIKDGSMTMNARAQYNNATKEIRRLRQEQTATMNKHATKINNILSIKLEG